MTTRAHTKQTWPHCQSLATALRIAAAAAFRLKRIRWLANRPGPASTPKPAQSTGDHND